ncbi:hypothetical protein FRC11_001814, partial [Ceratobasidium sp. 423]
WRSDLKAEDHRNIHLMNVNSSSGTTFNDYQFLGDPTTAYISQIRFRNTNQPVAGFQVVYSSNRGGNVIHQETPIRGTDPGTRDTWTLGEGEYITQVKGKQVNAVIYQLEFVTNKGNTKKFGQDAGTAFTREPDNKDMVLYFLIGSS